MRRRWWSMLVAWQWLKCYQTHSIAISNANHIQRRWEKKNEYTIESLQYRNETKRNEWKREVFTTLFSIWSCIQMVLKKKRNAKPQFYNCFWNDLIDHYFTIFFALFFLIKRSTKLSKFCKSFEILKQRFVYSI